MPFVMEGIFCFNYYEEFRRGFFECLVLCGAIITLRS